MSHNDSLTASDSLKFQFATDGEGNYGYLKGDDTFVPFKSSSSEYTLERNDNSSSTNSTTRTFNATKSGNLIVIVGAISSSGSCSVSVTQNGEAVTLTKIVSDDASRICKIATIPYVKGDEIIAKATAPATSLSTKQTCVVFIE